jgi:flagellar protein FlaG
MTINQIMASSGLTKPASTPTDAQRTQTPVASNSSNVASVKSSQSQPAVSVAAVTDEQVAQALEQIKDALGNMTQDLNFSIDEETGKTVVKIIDTASQEVIRQFPTEDAIAIARSLDKMSGLLFNDKA